MFYPPRLYLADRWTQWPLIGSGLLQIFMWWYTLGHVQPTAEPVFLHYTILFGVDFIGNWSVLLLPLFVGLGVIILNYGVSFALYRQNRLFARFLTLATVLIQLFIAIGVVLIVGLNS